MTYMWLLASTMTLYAPSLPKSPPGDSCAKTLQH